jgi:soluble lytic murein transglycosylase-like protein
MKRKNRLILIFAIIFNCINPSVFSANINIQRIIQIESAGNVKAFNRHSGARGLMQITEICLKDYNQFHKEKFNMNDMYNAEKNITVGSWYLNVRIPQLLKHFNLEISDKNIICAYNSGINNVKRGITPKETRNYIKKYFR